MVICSAPCQWAESWHSGGGDLATVWTVWGTLRGFTLFQGWTYNSNVPNAGRLLWRDFQQLPTYQHTIHSLFFQHAQQVHRWGELDCWNCGNCGNVSQRFHGFHGFNGSRGEGGALPLKLPSDEKLQGIRIKKWKFKEIYQKILKNALK